MPDIAIRDLTEEQYIELLKKKRAGNFNSWKEFFVEKCGLSKDSK